MTEIRHYFVHFFSEVEHVFGTKLVASYHIIILLWPRSLIKSITSDAAELLLMRTCWCPLVTNGNYILTFCVRQHVMFLFNTKLDTRNNVKGVSIRLKTDKRKPQTAFQFTETKAPSFVHHN